MLSRHGLRPWPIPFDAIRPERRPYGRRSGHGRYSIWATSNVLVLRTNSCLIKLSQRCIKIPLDTGASFVSREIDPPIRVRRHYLYSDALSMLTYRAKCSQWQCISFLLVRNCVDIDRGISSGLHPCVCENVGCLPALDTQL